jgi:hypothetical protein
MPYTYDDALNKLSLRFGPTLAASVLRRAYAAGLTSEQRVTVAHHGYSDSVFGRRMSTATYRVSD